MKDTLRYKGYAGSVNSDACDKLLHGKVLGINDCIGFQGTTEEELESDFKAGIEDYIEICQKVGKQPDKPLCQDIGGASMEPIATKEMDWETISEAVRYFRGQERQDLTLVNKFELRSLERLRKKLGHSEDEFCDLIESQLN